MTKKQRANYLGRKIWLDQVGTTIKRSTECDDVRISDYSWNWSKSFLSNNCPRIRLDAKA